MEKITATVYDTVDPYQWVTDIAHQAWKTRDQEVWANNIGSSVLVMLNYFFKSQDSYYIRILH